MFSVFNYRRTLVMDVVVFVFFLMQTEAFSGEEWEGITEIPTQRRDFATAVVDNKIYLIGGTLFENRNGPYGISTVEEYDSQTNTWLRVTDMPTPRAIAKAAVVNGIIYVFGGYNSKNRDIRNWKLPVVVEAYNPQTDTWIKKTDMPISRINFRLGVVDEKIYLVGGTTGFGAGHEERMDRVDIYDPETDTWAKAPKMPTRRDPMSVAVVNNRMYVIGGRGWPKAGGGPLLTVIEVYDPINRQWKKKNDILDVRQAFSTVVVADEIYLIGGFAHAEFLAIVEVYNPQKDTWIDIPELPTGRMPYGAAAVKSKVYVFAGYNRERGYFPDVLVYDTGLRAVEANGKMLTRWGELKAEREE